MSLSGGLDSRAILSAVPRDRFPIFTYTLGVKGCADQVIAARLSAIAGTSHRYFELDERYLQDYFSDLSQLVGLTDGMYLSHGLTEMLALRFLERESLSVLMRGHGGELAKMSLAWPFHVDQRISSMQTRADLVDYLHARFGYMSRGVNLSDLFTDDWGRAMDGQARRSLEAALPDADLRPSELCAYLYMAEGLRRYTVQSLEMFRSITEIRLPFADADYLEALLQGDPSWREGTEIHQAIVAANHHALLKVRNSNTGARVNAYPLEERVFDKMNTLFKRLNVYGYRHYHNFDAWMGRMLLASVENTLLGPQALGRGMFRKSAIERLIEDTKKGVQDHGYLLQALLIFELWQQQNDL
jgi:asparagine synthase (glutamine-hydrolysing)